MTEQVFISLRSVAVLSQAIMNSIFGRQRTLRARRRRTWAVLTCLTMSLVAVGCQPTARQDVSRAYCPAGMALVPGGQEIVLYYGQNWGGDQAVVENIAPFCIDIYEASQPDATADTTGSWYPLAEMALPPATSQPDVLPWTTIGWDTAREACERAGKRLPTLAEWQMAYSGASGAPWPWGDRVEPNQCNADNRPGVEPTGACCAEVCETWCFEVCDMLGNVAEWLADPWDPDCYQDQVMTVAGGSHNITYLFPNGMPCHNVQRPDPDRPGCWIMSNYCLDRTGLHSHLRDVAVNDDGFRCAKSIIQGR